jgi:hypothetical protein
MCSKTYADGKTGKRPVSAQSNSTDPCSDKILNFGHLTSEGIESAAAVALPSISLSLEM